MIIGLVRQTLTLLKYHTLDKYLQHILSSNEREIGIRGN